MLKYVVALFRCGYGRVTLRFAVRQSTELNWVRKFSAQYNLLSDDSVCVVCRKIKTLE